MAAIYKSSEHDWATPYEQRLVVASSPERAKSTGLRPVGAQVV